MYTSLRTGKQCRFCNADLIVLADKECPQKWVDKLLPMVSICNQCVAHVDNLRLAKRRVQKACQKLIRGKAERDPADWEQRCDGWISKHIELANREIEFLYKAKKYVNCLALTNTIHKSPTRWRSILLDFFEQKTGMLDQSEGIAAFRMGGAPIKKESESSNATGRASGNERNP